MPQGVLWLLKFSLLIYQTTSKHLAQSTDLLVPVYTQAIASYYVYRSKLKVHFQPCLCVVVHIDREPTLHQADTEIEGGKLIMASISARAKQNAARSSFVPGFYWALSSAATESNLAATSQPNLMLPNEEDLPFDCFLVERIISARRHKVLLFPGH